MLFERNAEHAWNDKDSVFNIHLNECNISGIFAQGYLRALLKIQISRCVI